MHTINLSGFISKKPKEIQKAYQEGVYSDTPANRKLGRAGLSYAQYEEKLRKQEDPKKQDKVSNYIPTKKEIEEYNESIPNPSVEDRWNAYSLFCNMVGSGVTKSLVAFGTGGVGKTFTMGLELKKLNLKEFDGDIHSLNEADEYDYVKITGSASGLAVYKTLFEFNNKLIIFDDCDSVLKDANAVNFLKGALDSSGDGSISYNSSSALRTEKYEGASISSTGLASVPSRFKFKGRVMFISNLDPQDIPQPLIDSRCLALDLSMSKDETISRIKQILPKMEILDGSGEVLKTTPEEKELAINFLDKYKNNIREGKLNTRQVSNIIKVIHASKGTKNTWESAALALLAN